MDIENSENKKFNSAVLERVQIMCQMFWGPDLESCCHMMEDNFFQFVEIILEKSEKRKSKEKPSVILDNINSIINGFDSPQSLNL